MDGIFRRIIFERKALNYPIARNILSKAENEGIEIKYSETGRITGIPGKDDADAFFEGKNTLVVGVRSELEFQSCKPSAHYQLPLVSGCAAMCEYCYLNTRGGKKPYVKVNVNIDEILNRAGQYIEERKPEITIFEGAATSDPVLVEGYSGALKSAIEYFAKSEYGRFRFVTKYADINKLCSLQHNNHTTIRFSINTERVIKSYEHRTSNLKDRIDAAYSLLNSGYKVGFIIGPVFLHENWRDEYKELLKKTSDKFQDKEIEFEIISHRFTVSAKNKILKVFPNTTLPMEVQTRKFKFGQFGYGKYIYNNNEMDEIKEFFINNINLYFNKSIIKYII
ncbi:spore photoproduct lyase [Clostridium felsineum]|uniref:spore photoproduct lyase n=1 Tax=Clostridium felsineum TaxID=36839 RepID=UPI00098BE5C4|nr:spore photoproduct lyase [Clostridium felsineum]URZ17618.1 Spore photoproduct lyase [Clostridium felsineum DSM 794]